MDSSGLKIWTPVLIVVLAGAIATALVPQTVPILGAIAKEFNVNGASLGWIVSFPTLICAFGALAFGVVVDRVGDVRLLLIGMGLVILGDAGVSLAPALDWLYGARLFQGLGYVCISVAAPTFIQRTTTGDTRRAAMALWAAHTPIGFAAAVYVGAQMIAAGFSWRFSFLPHAGAALVIGVMVLTLARAVTAANVRRSAGLVKVISSPPVYAVAMGALAAAMLQVSVMTLLPSILGPAFGISGPQAALVIVAALVANWLGSMLIVLTPARNAPAIALPLSAVAAAVLGFVIVTEVAQDLQTAMIFVLAFTASVGAANGLVWSLLPAAVPAPEAAGATAGLITQGSFLGVLVGPPTFFWIRHEDPMYMAALAGALALGMMVALFAHVSAKRAGAGAPVNAH